MASRFALPLDLSHRPLSTRPLLVLGGLLLALALPTAASAQTTTSTAAPAAVPAADAATPTAAPDAGVATTGSTAAPAGPAAAKGAASGRPSASLTALVPAAAQGSLFAGSLLTFRNSTSAIGLDKSAEPMWNPQYSMSLTMAPNVNLSPKFFVRGNLTVSREFTDADWTTYNQETMLSDTTFTLGYRAFRFPDLGLMWNFDTQLGLPTSKASQARTLNATTALGSQLIFFKGNFFAVASFRASKFWNSYTTSETETPWVKNCRELSSGCDPYLNTGVRNAEFRIVTVASTGYTVVPWLTLNLTGGVISDLLYKNSTQDATGGIAVAPKGDSPNYREFMYYSVSADFRVHPSVTLSVGTDTFNPQLAPDSTYQKPFFNRLTTLFFDVTFFPDRLVH